MSKKPIQITHGWVKDFLKELKDKGIKGFYHTGSNLFELSNKNSDYDYVVTNETWDSINEDAHIFYGKGCNKIDSFSNGKPEYEFENLKLQLDNDLFDFIVVPDEIEYKVWVLSTKAFLLLLDNVVIKKIMIDKSKRVEMFENLKNVFREYYKEDV